MSEQIEYHPDRTGWPPGPWDDEPDRADFVHAGLACFVQRNPMGAWCGYVGVPPDHPDYGSGYDDVDVDVHGGLTYAAACYGHLCHIPEPGMPTDVWWLGFDCAHGFDVVPRMRALEIEHGYTTYKSQPYARVETERLAEQLRART